jgi:hypothetical protein
VSPVEFPVVSDYACRMAIKFEPKDPASAKSAAKPKADPAKVAPEFALEEAADEGNAKPASKRGRAKPKSGK